MVSFMFTWNLWNFGILGVFFSIAFKIIRHMAGCQKIPQLAVGLSKVQESINEKA